MSERSTARDRLTPQDGDVVVTREVQSRVLYSVRQLPGTPQVGSAILDEAVRLARGFSRKHAVDVWYREAGRYRLLEAYRPRTLSAPGQPPVSSTTMAANRAASIVGAGERRQSRS